MNFFADAEAFIKKKQTGTMPSEEWDIDTPTGYNKLFSECRRLYENATKQEIERAINQVKESLEKPYDQSIFMKNLRTKLED